MDLNPMGYFGGIHGFWNVGVRQKRPEIFGRMAIGVGQQTLGLLIDLVFRLVSCPELRSRG